METSNRSLQRVAMYGELGSAGEATDLLFLEHYVGGTHPFVHSVHLDRVRQEASLRPPGTSPVRVAVHDGVRSQLVAGDDWVLCSVRWADGAARVSVAARSEDVAKEMLDEATRGAMAQQPDEPHRVHIGFWRAGAMRSIRRERVITAPAWPTIRLNYPIAAASALDALMATTPASLGGKLLLLYGPPGTGKTTALRSLAREWDSWCQIDYVLDPERLLGDPGYLMEVVLDRDDGTEEEDVRWRLLVLEDCDELIAASAKERAGQGLGRLLNLTDGLLGQGVSLLVAITTNEPVQRLHPAVVRPGRCFAQIEIGPMNRSEAADWLGRPPGPGSQFTLAELLFARDGAGPLRSVDHGAAGSGLYL